MASQNQSYRAGEARGQAEEKTGQMFDKTKNMKDQTSSYSSEKAGVAKEKVGRVGQQWRIQEFEIGVCKCIPCLTCRSAPVGQSAKENAEIGKEKTGGVMQRTSEQVKSMAQGAAEKVKETFGMAGSGEEDEYEDQDLRGF